MDAILWNTMTIQVPNSMVHYTPQGRVSIKKTLTRLHGVSRSARIPSINLVPSPDNKVHVVSQGNTYNVDDLRRRVQAGVSDLNGSPKKWHNGSVAGRSLL